MSGELLTARQGRQSGDCIRPARRAYSPAPAPALAHGPTRQRVSQTVDIARSPDEVWAIVKDFDAIARWHPVIVSSPADKGNEVGSKRMLTLRAPGGLRIYVSNPEGHSISVIERREAGHVVVAELPAGAGPLGIAVSPDGAHVFVADWYGDTVLVLDAQRLAPVGSVRVGQSPSGLAADPAGTRLYVANRESDTVSVVDLATLAVSAEVPAGRAPIGVTMYGAGRVFVANVQSGDVSVLDAATLAEVRRLKVGAFPYTVGVTPDGGRILVTNQHDGTVSVFDGGTYAPLGVIPVGEYPEGIAVSADGASAYVAVWMDDQLVEIDVAAGSVRRRVAVGGGPRAFGAFLGR